MKRFSIAVFAFSILLAMSCDKTRKDGENMPLRKEIMVKVIMDVPSGNAWDFMKEGKIHYRTDAGDEGVAALSDDSVFCADISVGAMTICADIGCDRDSSSRRTSFIKTALSSEEDLKEGMAAWSEPVRIEENSTVVNLIPATAGVRLRLFDSRHFALDERILEIRMISSTMDTTTLIWSPKDADVALKVNDYYKSSFAGLAVAPQKSSEVKFNVVTNRNKYDFTFNELSLEAGTVTDIALDFSKPDVQPRRKVGILGDSISTFFGYIDPSYSAYYPGEDAKGTNTVQSVDKTYWWKVIYEKMKYGELDVNNSYSGARVISESGGKGFVDRAYKFIDPDIIIIHGGTNDTTKSTKLGDYDFQLPMEQLDEFCYRSAFVKLIKMLQSRYEGVELIILVGDWLTTEYARSNIEIAEYFSLPCVDFTNGGTIMNDAVNIPKSRGGHPDAKGHQYIADRIFEQCGDYLP